MCGCVQVGRWLCLFHPAVDNSQLKPRLSLHLVLASASASAAQSASAWHLCLHPHLLACLCLVSVLSVQLVTVVWSVSVYALLHCRCRGHYSHCPTTPQGQQGIWGRILYNYIWGSNWVLWPLRPGSVTAGWVMVSLGLDNCNIPALAKAVTGMIHHAHRLCTRSLTWGQDESRVVLTRGQDESKFILTQAQYWCDFQLNVT